jgi:hypothetical protein
MNSRPILVVVLASQGLGFLRRVYRLLSRTAPFRLAAFAVRAAQFELRARDSAGEKQTLIAECVGSALVGPSLAAAEGAAESQGAERVWYRIRVSRDATAFGELPDTFALLHLATRTRGVVIDTKAGDAGMVPRGTAFVHAAAARDTVAGILRKSPPLLTKPVFQSEIGPNDYLKRVCGLRKAVLVSLCAGVSVPTLQRIQAHMCAASGRDLDELLFVVEGAPSGLVAGHGVQPIEELGFTSLERMAMARNVDFLVSDRWAYVLSALSKGTCIVIPSQGSAAGEAAFELVR